MTDRLSDNLVKKELAEAIVKNPKILYEQVLGQGVHTGTITFDRLLPEDQAATITIPFVLVDDFSFSLGNTWGAMVDGNFKLVDDIVKWVNALTGLSDNSYDVEMTYKNKVLGKAMYKGSDVPEFNVTLMFVCTQRSLDPSQIIKNISAMCLPTEMSTETWQKSTIGKAITGGTADDSGIANLINSMESGFTTVNNTISDKLSVWASKDSENGLAKMADGTYQVVSKGLAKAWNIAKSQGALYAPLGYKTGWDETNSVMTTQGTVSLQIGKWFKADNLVCNKMSGIKFSKETIAPPPEWLNKHSSSSIYTTTKDSDKWGFPLYATCTLNLRPVTYVTYSDFMKYFILPDSNATKSWSSQLGSLGNIGSIRDDIDRYINGG